MGFTGFYQVLCYGGHEYSVDVHEGSVETSWCSSCGALPRFSRLVDTTNGTPINYKTLSKNKEGRLYIPPRQKRDWCPHVHTDEAWNAHFHQQGWTKDVPILPGLYWAVDDYMKDDFEAFLVFLGNEVPNEWDGNFLTLEGYTLSHNEARKVTWWKKVHINTIPPFHPEQERSK